MEHLESTDDIGNTDNNYEEDDTFDDDDDEDDEGISFEKYAELSAKINGIDDLEAQYKIIEKEGYSKEDWNFYKKVWTVEMADPEKLRQYMELYANALK